MKRQSEGGFTLVELVFGAVIMSLMVASIGQLYLSNINSLVLGKSRAIALALANERMEALRDLPYDSLATQFGPIYPPGLLVDDETVVRNNYKFTVHTDISYVDDAYDGYISCPCTTGPAAGKPKDLYPYDYKKAQISVKLISSNRQVAVLTTDIAGKAAETASNTGILSVTVLNANGQPVPNATVHIVNTNPTPDVDITTTTDSNGLVIIPKLPPDSANRYQVTASYASYSTDGTIPDPAGAQTAVQLNPNILVQQITSVTLSIDQLSTLYVQAVDTSGAPINALNVTTTGAKKTKNTPDVFKYSQTAATDSSGNITLTGMEWDSYNFSLPAGYYLAAVSPYRPVTLDPNSTLTATLTVSTSSSFPRITLVEPATGQTGTAAVSVEVRGNNLSSGSTLRLKRVGQPDIVATGCASSGGSTLLTCAVSLTGAASGTWDMAVTNGTGTVTQTGGFSVTP